MSASLWAVFLLPAVVGCSGSDRTSVSGTFLRADGTPLANARVTARSAGTGKWATAITDEQGHFALGTAEQEAGLPPGDYYVLIVEDPDNPGKPRTIAAKYGSPSSGLKLTVKSGEPTVLDATLDPP